MSSSSLEATCIAGVFSPIGSLDCYCCPCQLAMLLALLFMQLSMLTPLDSPSSRSSLSPGFHSSGHGWPAGWTQPLQDRVNFATVPSLSPFPSPPLMHVRLPFSTSSVNFSSLFLFTPSRPSQLLQSLPSASTITRPQNRTSMSWRYRIKIRRQRRSVDDPADQVEDIGAIVGQER